MSSNVQKVPSHSYGIGGVTPVRTTEWGRRRHSIAMEWKVLTLQGMSSKAPGVPFHSYGTGVVTPVRTTGSGRRSDAIAMECEVLTLQGFPWVPKAHCVIHNFTAQIFPGRPCSIGALIRSPRFYVSPSLGVSGSPRSFWLLSP